MQTMSKLLAVLFALLCPNVILAFTQAESYGASPSASASTNLTAIQTALNQTGVVTLTTCGTYNVNGHLLITSNTYFRLAPCVQLFQVSGTNDNMLVNAGYANRGYVSGTFSYVSGTSSCTDGVQKVTFTNGGGSPAATGTVTVSGGVPTGSVTLTNSGGMYYALPTSGTIATCSGTATFSGGTLTGSSTPVTLSYASGTAMSVTWTSHGLSAGQYVLCQGSSPSTFNGVFKIISVTDPNHFVVELLRLPAAGPTGQAVAKVADQNIIIDGGVWDYNYPGNSGAMNLAHAINLGIVQDLTVRNIVINNVAKYTVYIGAARDVYTDNVGTDFTNSDLLHAAGPLYNVQFHNTWGRNGDDGVIIDNTDYPDYYATWTAGDVQNCVIDGVDIESSLIGIGLTQIYFSAGFYMGGIVVKNVSGSTLGYPVAISAYGTTPGAALDSIEVDNVTANYSIGGVRVQSTGFEGTAPYTIGTVHLSNLTYNPQSLTTGPLVVTDDNGTISNFILNGFTINNPNAASSGSIYFLSLDGSYGQVNVSNGYVNVGANGRLIGLINTLTTSTYGKINVSNINMPTGSQILTLAANIAVPVNITFNNNTFGVSSTAVSTKSPANITLSGNTFSNMSDGAVAIYASVPIIISGFGNQGLSNYWTVPGPYSPTVTEYMTTAAGSAVPSCPVYTVTNNGTNFTVAVNRGTALPGVAIPASTTASVVLFALPGKAEIDSITSKTATAWSSTGMTTATSTIGDSAGSGTSYSAATYNLLSAAANTNFQTARPGFTVSGNNAPLLVSKVTYAGSNVIATLVSNRNWNTASVSGSTDYTICWKTLP